MNQKDMVKSFIKALGSGNADALAELLTDDAQAICTGTSVLSATRDRNTILETAKGLSMVSEQGIDFTILTLTEEENRVSCEMTGKASLRNGTTYFNEYHFLFHFKDSKIQTVKEYLDTKTVDEVLAPLFA